MLLWTPMQMKNPAACVHRGGPGEHTPTGRFYVSGCVMRLAGYCTVKLIVVLAFTELLVPVTVIA
jgi:hypothetical protein